jgi:hypothetical protein
MHSGCGQPVMPQSPPPTLEVPLWFIWLLLILAAVPRSAAPQLLLAKDRLLPQQPEHLEVPIPAVEAAVGQFKLQSSNGKDVGLVGGLRHFLESSHADPRVPISVLQLLHPPIHLLASAPVGLGLLSWLHTPEQSLSGPQRPASLDMALVGVLPQCWRYSFQEFWLFSHLTLSQPVHLPRSAETVAGISTRDTAKTSATSVPKILLTAYASLMMNFDGILQGQIDFVNSQLGAFS